MATGISGFGTLNRVVRTTLYDCHLIGRVAEELATSEEVVLASLKILLVVAARADRVPEIRDGHSRREQSVHVFEPSGHSRGLKIASYEADGIVPFVANSPFMSLLYAHPEEYANHRNPEGALVPANRAWHESNGTYRSARAYLARTRPVHLTSHAMGALDEPRIARRRATLAGPDAPV